MRILALFSLLTLSLFAAGCGSDSNPSSSTDPVRAAAEAAAGDQALADGDFAAANGHYKTALELDPGNAQANIGAAITEIYLLQSDSEIDSLVQYYGDNPPPLPGRSADLESSPRKRLLSGIGLSIGDHMFDPLSPAKTVGRLTTLGTEDPPVLSDIQRVIRLKVMPKLQYAEDRLTVVEANPTWRYLLPPSVTEEPDTIEIDLGEVYTLDAVINGIQGWLGLIVAYDFDTPYGTANAESLLANGTAFGTLHTGGAAQLSNARLNWLNAKIRLDAAISFINAETDDQSDDVIPKEALVEPGFVQWYADFNQFQTSLSSPVQVSVNDYQNQPTTISLEIGKFFTNAIGDWKTKLPDHTYDVDHQPVVTDPVTFPDPLFNGIFPGMTNDAWRALLGPVNPVMVARR